MQISKVHKNILKKIKENTGSNKIDKIYIRYRNNIHITDSKSMFFSNFFLKCDWLELDKFEKELESVLFQHFIQKIKKDALKKSCHKYLQEVDVVKYLYDLFKKEKDLKTVIKKIKNNIISQDEISNKSMFLTVLKNSLNKTLLTIENIKKEIKKNKENTNSDTELEQINEDIFIVRPLKFEKNLIKNITPNSYCINQNIEHFFTYISHDPIFIIYDFSKPYNSPDYLYYVMVGKGIGGLNYYIYDKNNERRDEEEDVKKIKNILKLMNSNLDLFYYDNVIRFLKGQETDKILSWSLSMEYFIGNKNLNMDYLKSKINNKKIADIYLSRYLERYINWMLKEASNLSLNNEEIKDFVTKTLSLKLGYKEKLNFLMLGLDNYDKETSEKSSLKNDNAILKILLLLSKDLEVKKILLNGLHFDFSKSCYEMPIEFLNKLGFFEDLTKIQKIELENVYEYLIKKEKKISEQVSLYKKLVDILNIGEEKQQKLLMELYKDSDEKNSLVFYEMLTLENKKIILNELDMNQEDLILKIIKKDKKTLNDEKFLENDLNLDDLGLDDLIINESLNKSFIL